MLKTSTLYLFIVFMITLSCSETSDPNEISNLNSSKLKLQNVFFKKELYKTAIESWEIMRHDSKEMISQFNYGNSFKFKNQNWSKKGYVLVYPLINNGRLGFYIFHENDIDNPKKHLYVQIEKGFLKTDFKASSLPLMNSNSITWEEATKRVSNWENTKKRADWIEGQVQKGKLNSSQFGIFQYALVPAINFKEGITHTCFIGLKDDNEMDLFVMNNFSNGSKSYQDVTRLVPPFSNGDD